MKKGSASEFSRQEFRTFQLREGIDWVGVLDFIKAKTGLIEDKQLATYLHVPQSTLSSVRSGKAELSTWAKFRLLDRFGFHLFAEMSEVLMTDEMAAKLRRAQQRQSKKLAGR